MPFDYYNSNESIADCAKWLAFLRLFCLVRTPACVYSCIKTPSSKKIGSSSYIVPVPDFVSNILVDLFADVSAREAAILEAGRSSVTSEGILSNGPSCATGVGDAVWAWGVVADAGGDGLGSRDIDGHVRGLLVEAGVLPVRVRQSSRFKPGVVRGLRVTEATVVRLGASLVVHSASALQTEAAVVGKAIAAACELVSRGLEPCAPLWLDEVNWIEKQGYAWHGAMVVR